MADIESLVYTYPDINDPDFQRLLSLHEEFWPDQVMSARDRIRQFVKRFMVQYERLFLFYSTGAGKTCMASGAAEPLIRDIVSEVYETYLSPVRTNINKVIVILTSDPSRNDFMQKVIENCHPHLYEKVRRETEGADITTRLALYTRELSKYYSFETKQNFLTSIYGQSSEKIEAPEARLKDYHNKFIIIDEIHTFSREDASISQSEEDIIYARYHNILHRLKGSKVMIMSATPMKDRPSEIIKIMNLILPLDKQMPENLDVFDREGMRKYLSGYISYYQMTGIRTIERGIMLQLGEDPGEFTTVYPVRMSDFQAETYRRVIKEKDQFNRNALKTSNIVHPQGISRSDFLANYIESPRGGYEANSDFKRFLRQRENREKLSPKFCAVINLVKNNQGVIFCYMHGLQFGIYDLATYFELEGFERYTARLDRPAYTSASDDGKRNKIHIDKKPRFAVLVGETKTVKGKLVESTLALSNLPENVDGEYIKVIIGSSAIKEAYDIFNCLNVIIVSPEQTETSMIQAIGRATRSGGLDTLLSKYPDMKAIVNVYKMASYAAVDDSSNPYSMSKDIDTYVESARKDRNIKRVERLLRENAVDCQIHHDLNYNGKNIDRSYACLYGDCDYTCAVESKPDEDEAFLETDAMNVLYQGDKIASIINRVREIFKEKFYISIEELASLAADSQSLAFRAIEEMSIQKMRVINRFGQSAYVYFDRKGAYISSSSTLRISGDDNPVHPVEYSHYITSVSITPLDELVNQPVRIPDMLERIMTTNQPVTDSLETDQELLDRFKFFIRRETISKAEVLEHIRIKGRDKEQRSGITGTTTYWINFSGKLLTHGEIKVYEGDVGILRVPSSLSDLLPSSTFDEGSVAASWVYPDRYLGRVLNRIYRKIMVDKFAPYENKYKYFGVTLPTENDVLRIAESDKDNAKNPGKVWKSWKRETLINVARYVGISNIQDTSKFVKDWCKMLMEEFKKRDMLLVL